MDALRRELLNLADDDDDDDSSSSSSSSSDDDASASNHAAPVLQNLYIGSYEYTAVHKVVITFYVNGVFHFVKSVCGTVPRRRETVDFILYDIDALRDLPREQRVALACPSSVCAHAPGTTATVRFGNWTILSTLISHLSS
jgi:hypothetical protein